MTHTTPLDSQKHEAARAGRFIIGHGWVTDVDVIEAESLEAAEAEAAKRTVADGVPISDLADHAWAEPYTDDLAYELGVLPIEDTSSAMRCRPFQRW